MTETYNTIAPYEEDSGTRVALQLGRRAHFKSILRELQLVLSDAIAGNCMASTGTTPSLSPADIREWRDQVQNHEKKFTETLKSRGQLREVLPADAPTAEATADASQATHPQR